MDVRKIFGNRGEDAAADFLERNGMTILCRQYKNQFGEIDLVCRDCDEVVFVEVKSRYSNARGYPEDSVTQEKIGHIVRVGEGFLLSLPQETQWRIDVVAIEFEHDPLRITHIKGIDIPEKFW
jgi:putative endonuclease